MPSNILLPMAEVIKPVKDRRFSLGVSAAAVAFKPAPDRRWLGFSGSAYGAYQLSPHWSASIGIGMRYQPGSWIDSSGVVESERLLYSFGFTSEASERRVAGLLSLEIPLAAIWHNKAFAFEAGVAPGFLCYALDRYKANTESSLEAKKTTRNRLERSDKTPFGKYYANTFLGAEWKFSRNTSITLQGNYRFGAIVKTSTDYPAVKGGSGVALGIRLKLF